MTRLLAAFAAITRVLHGAGTVGILVMTLLVALAAIMRYVFHRPFAFTEELVALLYMASVFLVIPAVTLGRGHISVAVLPAWVTQRFRRLFRVLAATAMIAFCTWFAVESYGFAAESLRFNSTSEQVNLLLWPWMALMPLSMAFVAVIALVHLIEGRHETKAPDDDVDAL